MILNLCIEDVTLQFEKWYGFEKRMNLKDNKKE
jgi:hypothetical protein